MPCTHPDAACVHLSCFSFPSTFTLYFFLVNQVLPVPWATGEEEKFSKKLGWKIREVPRKKRKVMLSFRVANQAESQADCNLFLLSLAFFQAVFLLLQLLLMLSASFVLEVVEYDAP